jgi:hypothetical protein
MGMCLAPRSELYVDLACLAHPPRVPSAIEVTSIWAQGDLAAGQYQTDWTTSVPINASLPMPPTMPKRSPADEWFIKLQRKIYDYDAHHPKDRMNHTLPVSTPSTSHTLDAPRPTTPSKSHKHKQEEKVPAPDTGAHRPYEEIDPSRCKRDPGVQAAAARITMSECGVPIILLVPVLSGFNATV